MRDAANDWRDEIRRRLEPVGLRPTREAEIVEEVAQHCEDRYRELLVSGASETDARNGAMKEIDDVDVLRREVALVDRPAPPDLPPPGAYPRGSWIGGLWQDIGQARRILWRAPSFSVTVLAAFALTIGPTTAIVSVANWLMWRPQPGVSQPRELAQVLFGEWRSDSAIYPMPIPRNSLRDLVAQSSTLVGMAGGQEHSASLAVPGRVPRDIGLAHVNGDYFDVLGVRMRAGRPLASGDDKPGAPHVALMAEGMARSTFGRPEAALDRVITLNNRPFTVIGVVDGAFSGISPTNEVDVWVPASSYFYLRHAERVSDSSFYSFVARLAPGASAASAADELNGRMRALFTRDPKTHNRFEQIEARVFPGLGEIPLMRPHRRPQIRTMLAIAIALLTLGCANVANLFVFRTTRGQHEIAVRKALGASRARLIQSQLVESCILALSGATVGLGLAFFLKQLMQQLLFPRPPGMELTVPLDARVLGMTVAAAIMTGIISAAAPALVSARRHAASGLSVNASRISPSSRRLRGGLASLQLALSLVLLIGAMLLVTTVRNLRGTDLGFDPDRVTAMSVSLDSHGYKPDQVIAYLGQVLPGMSDRGEFEDVALAVGALEAGWRPALRNRFGDEVVIATNGVTHNYFRTLGIPIVRGRDFSKEEAFTMGGDPPVIVNASLAMAMFGTLDVVGRDLVLDRYRSQSPRRLPIIGVAGDVRMRDLSEPPPPAMYQPFGRFETAPGRGEFLVRSSLPALRVGALAAGISSRAASGVPLVGVRPLSTDIDRQLSRERLFSWLLGLLGSFGFVLAALGLYGLVAQIAAERRREFGIRIAIGAQHADIVRLIARYALAVSTAGIVLGLGLSFYGSRLVESMLFGVTRLEPSIYAAAVVTLVTVVALACIAPIRRATRVQPVDVLRAE